MRIDEDYKITEDTYTYKAEDDLFGVELLTGDFAGIKYTYGTINVSDQENPDGTYSITFNYDVREGKVEDSDTEKFEKVIGSVLNSVLLNSLEEAHQRYQNETRNTNTQAPD